MILLIQNFVKKGRTVATDDWAGYSRLGEYGFDHQTVFRKSNFVNRDIGFHTQAIERAWQEGRAICKRARLLGPNLHPHLDEVS